MKRRGRLARLDDRVLGERGSRRAWYSDILLGLHPFLFPVYMLVAVAGAAFVVGGVITGNFGLAGIGLGWLVGGLIYARSSKGKSVLPPRR